MILVAGLSPAWQRILTFDDFRPSEVNRARTVVECPSGKVINVAIALQSLSQSPHLLTIVGGTRGRQLRQSLQIDFALTFDALESEAETRYCQTLLSQSSPATTELVEECQPLEDYLLAEFQTRFTELTSQATCIVLTGSVPANVPPSIYHDLLQNIPIPAIVDAQGELLKQSLPAGPLIVKPNRKELQNTFSRKLTSESQIIGAARELQAEGARWVIVTDGPNPILAVGPETTYRVSFPPTDNVINPIGCGDSLTAGLAAAIATKNNDHLLPALQLGVACALANLTAPRPALLDPQRVESLRSQIQVTPI